MRFITFAMFPAVKQEADCRKLTLFIESPFFWAFLFFKLNPWLELTDGFDVIFL